MGSRRCCCGIVKVVSCKSCCGNCISAHKIEDEYGNHTFANQAPEDKIILHQGAGYSPDPSLKQVNSSWSRVVDGWILPAGTFILKFKRFINSKSGDQDCKELL